MSCSWCQKEYRPGDDIIDRMEWCATQDGWAVWNGETIHRDCDYDRYDYEMNNIELQRLQRMKQTRITDYFKNQ